MRPARLLIPAALVGLGLGLALLVRDSPPGAPGASSPVVRSTAAPPAGAAPAVAGLRLVDTIALPDDEPPTIVRVTTDGRRAVVASTFGIHEVGTVVVDLAARTTRVVPLTGGVLDSARGLVVGMTVDAGSAAQDEPDLVVALRLSDDAGRGDVEAWRRRVGFCGGTLALHPGGGDAPRDLLFVALQGGGRRHPDGPDGPASRGGDDPLFVLDAATGEVLAGPIGTGGVLSHLVVDATGRAWVDTDQRTLIYRPWPALILEDELLGAGCGAVDPTSGRGFLRNFEPSAVVVTLDHPGDAPRRTTLPAPQSYAMTCSREGRLYLTDTAAGRIRAVDARTLRVEDELVVDPSAMQSALAITPDGRRLLLACSSGPRRTLYILAIP